MSDNAFIAAARACKEHWHLCPPCLAAHYCPEGDALGVADWLGNARLFEAGIAARDAEPAPLTSSALDGDPADAA